MSNDEEVTSTGSMLVIVLMELIKELRKSKSIDAGRLADNIASYASDARMDDASRKLLREVAELVNPDE